MSVIVQLSLICHQVLLQITSARAVHLGYVITKGLVVSTGIHWASKSWRKFTVALILQCFLNTQNRKGITKYWTLNSSSLLCSVMSRLMRALFQNMFRNKALLWSYLMMILMPRLPLKFYIMIKRKINYQMPIQNYSLLSLNKCLRILKMMMVQGL